MDTVKMIALTVSDTSQLMVSFIPVGFLASAIPLAVGLVVSGLVKIFKQA
ncbi:hypothetical protein MCG98_04295 [Ruminococcus sp. OA3]|nr:hypothetical protein [Ruminococcus sp. OA3]MCH1981790.1 hypothetical protein [Ruminococcus sp. OA3]